MSREAHVRFWEGVGVQLLCATQLLVLNERHLRRILTRYFSYYHRTRTHLALDKDAPDGRLVGLPEAGRIMQIPEVGGLHHRYVRRAA
jgi:putative transposase